MTASLQAIRGEAVSTLVTKLVHTVSAEFAQFSIVLRSRDTGEPIQHLRYFCLLPPDTNQSMPLPVAITMNLSAEGIDIPALRGSW